MSKLVDLRGKKFGRLTPIENKSFKYKNGQVYTKWRCKCDCGNDRWVNATSLKKGLAKSCGCLVAENNRRLRTTHGGHGTKLYGVWRDIITRCTNPSCADRAYYYDKDISICSEWRNDFGTFRDWALANGYFESENQRTDCVIDRKNSDGNYEPSNCRWVTAVTNSSNRRGIETIDIGATTGTLNYWCNLLNIDYSSAYQYKRRNKCGILRTLKYYCEKHNKKDLLSQIAGVDYDNI